MTANAQMRAAALGVGALALAVATAACGGDRPEPPTGHAPSGHSVTGELVLRAGDDASTGCTRGLGGYADIGVGTQVTVTDGNGVVLGLGTLATGVREGFTCRFTWQPINGIPDRNFYGVEVAHRGVVKFSSADMQTNGYRVSLTLG